MRYSRRFRRIHPGTLAATDALFSSRPWAGTHAQRTSKFRGWVRAASRVYEIEGPATVLAPPIISGHGRYISLGDDGPGMILLPRHSVVTLFHEYRHHMQRAGMQILEDPEDDARAWSMSLFRASRPGLCMRAVERGAVFFP